MPVDFFLKRRKGFTLLEILIAIAVLALFLLGVYSGMQFILKVVYQSRLRIIETSIINEQIEIVRNMSFYDVGIVNGSPAGLLDRTVTTTRNGIDFVITRTVRNIDDPFDGTIGGSPNDISPADYKLLEIDVICIDCGQLDPVSAVTQVAPKYLEGDPDNGALFVQVFDANAQPVQGVDVHIVATSTDPTFDFTDTTGNDGFLRVVDLPSGLNVYHLTISKDGYTTAQTMTPTVGNPNPTKLPASVIAQDVSQISFSIDLASSLALTTMDSLCQAVGNVSLDVMGTELIGTEPDVLLVDQSVQTDASGLYTLNNLHWDVYGMQVSGYDLLGSIPGAPINVLPGATQQTTLVVGPDTTNSLIVYVRDSVNDQPVSSASVRLSGTGYDTTLLTGVGHVRQTDWSGGSGQTLYTNNTRYDTDDGNVDVLGSPGDIRLRNIAGSYSSSGNLTSSIFDLGTDPNYVELVWEPLAQVPETGQDSVKFRIATSNTTTPASWDFLGPDGTSSTYYTATTNTIHVSHDTERYMKYRLFLSTASTTYTPTLSDVSFSYTNSCTPPGQVYFGSLSAQDYSIDVDASGFQTSTQPITISGDTFVTVDLVSS